MGGFDEEDYSSVTEEYNGSTWSSGGSLNTAREELAGGGNASNAICFGGSDGTVLKKTETYNGTAWSTSDDLGTARHALAGGGSSSSAISMGGDSGWGSFSAVTETFSSAEPVPRTWVVWV